MEYNKTIIKKLIKMRNILKIYLIFFLLFLFSACQEKKERTWYSKEAKINLKICVYDSCDVFIINDYDSIYTKHNRVYYEGYFLHFVDNTDSLFVIDRYNQVFYAKQKNYIITVDTLFNGYSDIDKILDKKGITIRGAENGHWSWFENKEYKGELTYVRD